MTRDGTTVHTPPFLLQLPKPNRLTLAILKMVRGEHSDLEVLSHAENIDQQKFPYYSPEPIPAQHYSDDTNKIAYQSAADEHAQSRTICGLRKRTFWIIVIVAILVVAASVGGGVGGALSSRSSGSSSNSNSVSQSQSSAALDASTTPTPTSAEPSTSISTTQVVGPTTTLLRDCPSSNNSVYSTTFGSTTMQFRKACELSFLNANGIDSVVNKQLTSLDDCINACATYNIQNRTRIAQGTDRICNSVCWRNTFNKINDQAGGQCFGFTTQNNTQDGQSTWRFRSPPETRCDSAALINQDY
ncbi:Nn.00g107900.m01.CDS01 [Neocucurbitaria sp. VM-36]